MKDKPFWENSYNDLSVSTFGIKPNQTIEEMWMTFDKNWNVLDVGCGEGKSSLFLAEKGFNYVEAFDISEAGIKKLLLIAQHNHIKINAYVDDIRSFNFNKQYDLIMSYGTLHFLEKEVWKKFLDDAKSNTNVGGIHIMQIFTNTVPASKDIEAFVKGLSDEGELKLVYDDWEIIQFNAYVFEDEHPGVEKHLHASNRIVAKKIK